MKNKLNYKLLNVLVIVAIVCLLYLIKNLWIGIVNNIFSIIAPFLLAFAIAYAIYPMVRKLNNSGSPKWLSILVTLVICFGFLLILILLVVPLLYEQTLLFISNISVFLSDISSKYSINVGSWQTSLSAISSDIIKGLGNYISNGALNIVNTSINFFTNTAIVFCSVVYFLVDMDKIRKWIKTYFSRKNRKFYHYLKSLDVELGKYVLGMCKNVIVQMVEYTVIFFIIGHPNYLIVGVLSGVSAIIPWFGGFIVTVLSLLVSSVLGTKLFIATAIVCMICPILDGNVIGPKIYGKSNKLHPLLVIFAVFAGGIIAGFWGIVISIPVAIILKVTYNFYKKDINRRIVKIKRGVKNEET